MSNSQNRAALFTSTTDDWPTPQDFYSRLNDEFGFVLDVCSSKTNHKAAAYYALDHEDESRRDGLNQDWATEALELGGAIWMNPPYGDNKWMQNAFTAGRAGATVVTLIPVRANTRWWHEFVLSSGAEVRYVKGGLKFGNAKNAAPFASAVVIYRPTDRVGAPGPVATMDNVIKTKAGVILRSPASQRAYYPLEVTKTIETYTPRAMSSSRWAVAAPAVRAAVAATRPTNVRLARARLTAAVNLLETRNFWAGTTAPDLGTLMTEARITRHLEDASTAAVVAARGSHLRAVAAAARLKAAA